MSKSTLVINDKMPALLKAMSALVKSEVLVGVPAESTERNDGEPINNATLGYIHETGAPAAGIPARPFLVPGVSAVEDKVAQQLGKAAQASLKGDQRAVDQRLHAAGLVAETSVKNTINAGIDPALADSTLRARARKGREGAQHELNARSEGMTLGHSAAKPLVDTGKLRNSITHVVRRK